MKYLAFVVLCLLAGATLAACGQTTYNDLVYPGWGSQPENQ